MNKYAYHANLSILLCDFTTQWILAGRLVSNYTRSANEHKAHESRAHQCPKKKKLVSQAGLHNFFSIGIPPSGVTFCGQMMRAELVNYYKSCSLNSLRVVARLVFLRLIFSGFSFGEIDTRTPFCCWILNGWQRQCSSAVADYGDPLMKPQQGQLQLATCKGRYWKN